MSQKISHNFSEPNKLDRKALFLVLGTALWSVARAIWPILAIIFVNKEIKNFYLIAVIGVVVLLTFLSKLINYFYFTYQLVGDELVIKKGWLSKSTISVKLNKIHEVNLNQKFIHKLIGLYVVTVDTAGSSKSEIEINGIDFKKALMLKEVLTSASSYSENVLNAEDVQEIVPETKQATNTSKIIIGITSLIKIGLTRNYMQTFGLLLAFSFQIIDQLQDLFYDDDASVYDDIFERSSQNYFSILGVIGFFGIIILVVVFNLVRTLLTYYNYQINLKEKHITASYGLTDSHIISVPANKVQMFQFQQNYFQKLMNLVEVKILQVDSNEDQKNKKGLIIPGANRSELQDLFQVIFNEKPISLDQGLKPHVRILQVRIMLLCIPVICALFIMYYTEILSYSWSLLVFFILGSLLIYRSYRTERMIYTGEFIVLKKGIWDISTIYLPIDKVQKVAISQSYFQEKKQVGSLAFYTAAGIVSLNYYDYQMLGKLMNELLYKLEKNKNSWM